MKEKPPRSAVPVEETWDLDGLVPSSQAWEQACSALEDSLPAVMRFQGTLHRSAADLLGCLQARDSLLERLGRLSAYASLQNAADATSPGNQALQAKMGALESRIGAALAWVTPEIMSLPQSTVDAWLQTEPGLAAYRHHLRSLLAQKDHILSPEAERALAALGQALGLPRRVHHAALHADLACNPITVGGTTLPVRLEPIEQPLYRSGDRRVRQAAYESVWSGLGRYKTVLATTLAGAVRKNVVLARLRGYQSAAHAAFEPDRVPLAVYHNVLDVILTEMAPHVRRLMDLRRRALGVDRLYRYDLDVPLDGAGAAAVPWEQGAAMIRSGLAVLGEEYGRMLHTALTERWVDRADNLGKENNAFCHSVYGWHPVVLVSWTDSVRSTFVLAHELGHAGHGWLAMQNQAYVNAGYYRGGRFFVEAPSTLNEVLLGHHLLHPQRDPAMRRQVLQAFIQTFTHNMVTRLLMAELERRLYGLAEAGKPLTLDVICREQGDVFQRFFGDTVVTDDLARLDWMQWGHFYTGFYPVVYAAGLSAACAVAGAMRREGAPAVERWLAVLKAGGTAYPLELLQRAGVDMSSPDPVRQAIALFGQLVAELEKTF